MSYVIEDNIPAPPVIERGRRSKSPIRAALEALEPGQSFLMQTAEEYGRARSAVAHIIDGQFVSRKIPGEGWRLWRVA